MVELNILIFGILNLNLFEKLAKFLILFIHKILCLAKQSLFISLNISLLLLIAFKLSFGFL